MLVRPQQAPQRKPPTQQLPSWPSKTQRETDVQKRLLQLEEEIRQLKAHGTNDVSAQNPIGEQAVRLISDQVMTVDDEGFSPESIIFRGDPPPYTQEFATERASIDDECQGQSLLYGSLAMQIRELRDSIPEWELTRKARACFPVDLETCLVPSMRLFQLLEVYFVEFNFSLPVVHRTEFTRRLRALFATHYNKRTARLSIKDAKPEEITFLALTCMMLAKAEHLTFNPLANTNSRRYDQGWFVESKRIMAQYYRTRPVNFDLVRLRLVESFYMVAIERVDRFSVSVIDAVNEALTAGLNNQKTWAGCSADESSSNRALWWVLYLMDRQAAQRYGRSYLIHDTDFMVDDFSEECRQVLSTDRSVPIPFLYCEAPDRTSSSNAKKEPQPAYISQYEWFSYLQFLATIGRLTARACDSFYCLRPPKAGDYEETTIIDALLLRASRSMCPTLVWQSDSAPELSNLGQPAAKQVMGLRLLVYLRINNLRLSIRRHLWKDRKLDLTNASRDRHSEFIFEVHVCRQIASDIITALMDHNSQNQSRPPITPFSAISVIECIYNLVALPKVSSLVNDNHCEFITEKVKKGVQCLEKLAQLRDTVAQTAYHVLKGFLQPGICVLHRSHERGSNCTILTPKQSALPIFNPSADELSNLFPLTDDSFKFTEPGSYVGLDFDNVYDSIGDTEMLNGWSTGTFE
ncbi:Fungal specific transcription factor domain-containing protein [Cladophialophora immunda]|nr:Fungal specific transcription factor domain-containing protein [Cladophialophora immunda]